MPKWYFDNKIVSNPGSEIHIIYKPVVDDKGNVDLVEAGKENLREIIQSAKDSCDITVILSQAATDPSVLNRAPGVFGDFTKMPETYAEMLQLQIDSKRYFEKLPIEIKKKFDNDPMKFMAQAGEKEWFEKISNDTALDINVPKESSEAAATKETGKGE